jgi:glycosyltransferase involved in cell wall biosynthesis
MKIWIVNPYGSLPSEGWREYRSFMLAKALAARGHEVTWWISDFIHRSKTYRANGVLNDPLLPSGVRVIGVHSTSYARNISWARIQYEKNYGKELIRLAEAEKAPDLIVMGDPALFFGKSILAYRKAVGCKLVLDVIDLWPELFTVALPKWLQPMSRLIFYPLYQRRINLVSLCDGVVAVSRDYLKTALSGQENPIPNRVIYWGIDNSGHHAAAINKKLYDELNSFKSRFDLTAVYAGTLGDAYDMDIIIEAVKLSQAQNLKIGFVVAGDGPRKQSFVDMAGPYASNLKFVGALPASDMTTLYANSDVGLMTYVAGSTVAMPIKFFDYLVGGLAILNSLERDVREVIRDHEIGLNYIPENCNDFLEKLNTLAIDKQKLTLLKKNSEALAMSYDTRLQYEAFSEFIE